MTKANVIYIVSLLLLAPLANAQQMQLVSREEALSAYSRFSENPIENLDLAPTFLKFIQTDGEAHIVLDEKLTPWMYDNHAPEIRAVLFAAYMGSNMNAQLTGISDGDDAVQGINGVLDAYQVLKTKHKALDIPMLEDLAEQREQGSLSAAIKALQTQQ